MKKFKLIFATLVAALFTFAGGKALAYDITINNGGSGTYESYQIFTGTVLDNSDEAALGKVQWGNGITDAGKAALQTKYSASSAAEIAEKLGDNAVAADEFAKEAGKYLQNAGGLTGLAAGYYLVQNKTVGDHEAYTNYILKVVKNVTVEPKTDTPTVEKKVKDINDSESTTTTGWQDSADYDINDDVPFQLTATLPNNFATYDEYYLEFADTLSSGLTYNKNAKVFLVNGSAETDVTSSFTIAEDGSSFKINNLRSISGVTASSKIVVRYTAKLNTNAAIGSAGNPNTVKLIYSNNPNATGTGETTPDTVIVFTYKVVVNKVDQDNKPLSGAGFTLYKKVHDTSKAEGYRWDAVGDEITGGTTFTFSGIDDGDYKLVETTTPNGYNTIDDVKFTVTADHDVTSDSPALKSLSGVDSTGKITFNSNTSEGSLTAPVPNTKGSILPSTGGMGTKVLYAVGVVLILIAGVLIVTKKRMEVK
ncbi:isopeptide-forming domain-containing fimbrial protein [Streptococcus equinus]|uniref:isopeptide-forming domain-containing fimbrial protein n=1 Tax=Streptococcus equinus TaxID=1335 RepID=UPI0008ECF5E7|nr:isopeptide-forming domain-containing fimbrial protein [Streptococcus equinus]SFQ72607.1 LPXTG-motif cell wall anchor domain-containing protein/fimbrial isopeptide formation D2 domain-containing protein [Streptococcus equinus]